MSTARTIRSTIVGDPPMSQLARMYEAYFVTLERQAVRFETLASKLDGEHKQAILYFVAGLRKELQTLREQVNLFAEWG